MGKRGIVLLAAGAAVMLLVACGGGGGGTSGGDQNTAAAVPTGGAAGNTLSVTLGENGADDMYLNLSQPTTAAGEVKFVVSNEGNKEHEFVVLKTDTQSTDFPIVKFEGEPNRMDEDAAGVEALGEIGKIPAGQTKDLTVDLKPGHYVLLCNLKDHYPAGMAADLQVT